MVRRLVVGDIHGAYSALLEVFEKANFNYEEDLLIVLGDVVDGHPYVKECVDELLKVKNLIFVYGNHDYMFQDFITHRLKPNMWVHQGGTQTLVSYGYKGDEKELLKGGFANNCKVDLSSVRIPDTHKKFFTSGVPYKVLDNKLFVHGGINPEKPIGEQSFGLMTWDRSIIGYCKNCNVIPMFDEVFIGHTTTQYVANSTYPQIITNLILVDTGAGWDGRLTLMDIDTKQFWQSSLQIPKK